MKIEIELRPCKVNNKKCLFHRWVDKSKIIEPSTFAYGHSGGVLKWTAGIVEYENGEIAECLPEEIQFTDCKINEYCFHEK